MRIPEKKNNSVVQWHILRASEESFWIRVANAVYANALLESAPFRNDPIQYAFDKADAATLELIKRRL